MTEYKIRTRTGRETFAVPEHTEVAAVAALAPRFAETTARGESADARARRAHQERQRFDGDSKREIRRAARAGDPSPAKKLVKRLRALDEEVAEADFERDGAIEGAAVLKAEALVTVVKHAPALRAEAVGDLDADILRIATVHGKLREVAAGFLEHGGTLVLLERLRVGKSAAMNPMQGAGAQASIALSGAINALADAVRHATEFMEQAKVAPMPTIQEVDDDEADEHADDDEPAGDAMVIDTETDDEDDDDD